MKNKILIVAMTMAFLLMAGTAQASDPFAAEIIQKMDTREDGDTQVMDTLMVLIDKADQKRTRNIRNIRRDDGPDTRRMVFFLSPADVRNTSYLSHDFDDPDKEDDSWLFLPALAKVKRIAAGDKIRVFHGQ